MKVLKTKTALVFQVSIFLFLDIVLTSGASNVATLKTIKDKESYYNLAPLIHRLDTISDELFGPNFNEAQKNRFNKVEEEIRKRIEEHPVIQAMLKEKQEVIRQIRSNLTNPAYDISEGRKRINTIEEIIQDKRKQIEKEVRESKTPAELGGLLGDIRKNQLKKEKRKWKKIQAQMEEIRRMRKQKEEENNKLNLTYWTPLAIGGIVVVGLFSCLPSLKP